MIQIIDGCHYEVTDEQEIAQRQVSVYDINGGFVGSVLIDHFREYCTVLRNDGDDETSLNYYIFETLSAEEIARWIVGTSY